MSTQEKISADLKEAMKNKDSETLSVLRMLSAAIQSKQIEKRAKTSDQGIVLSDEDVMAVIKQEAKKRQESQREFTNAGRSELAAKEEKEFLVLQKYLPKEMDDGALEIIIKRVVENHGTVTEKDFGKLMGAAMKETKGGASGERVQAIIKKILNMK